MITLKTPVADLTRVGQSVAGKLKRLNILTVEDLIFWYPFRYDDFSRLKKIAALQPGEIATVKGKIELLETKRSPRKKMTITECFLSDDSGSVKAVWFRQPFIAKTLRNNDEVYFSGKVDGDLFNLFFKNPAYEKVRAETAHTARIVPIYPLTEGLSQKQLRFLIRQALPAASQLAEWLPPALLREYNLPALQKSLINIHFPENQKILDESVKRLKFDELLELHLQNYLLKKDLDAGLAEPVKFNKTATQSIVANLGFKLTNAQRKAAWQILQDMSKDKPMNRLVEGDVGSGKTVVAALAAANTALNGLQTAVLAPTEILAAQHFKTFKDILKAVDCNLALVTSSQRLVVNTQSGQVSGLSKAKIYRSIAEGEIDLTIGTQAIIQAGLTFKNLALTIIDEQHRFGVEQRKTLRNKSGNAKTTPHLLSLTATPIPRTLALTVYGDLHLSVIEELPPGRKKPLTQLVDDAGRDQAYDFILKQIKTGRQAFVVCPLIDESDKLGVKSAKAEHQKLTEQIFPQLNIGLLHGRLKPREKEKVMDQFTRNKIQILVATSVVEVGVNVPNASVMIIESAERFGLAQLHQFRGRVNRSHHQAYCFLFTEHSSGATLARLKTLVDCFDGFKLAEIDLKLRGAGDLGGTRQSGFNLNLKIASLADLELIEKTKKALDSLVKDDPELKSLSGRKIRPAVIHPE